MLAVALKINTMTKQELKQNLNQVGVIIAGKINYKKTMFGKIVGVDVRGNIWFMDNDGFGHTFSCDLVDSFTPQEFKSLPDNVYWKGGVVYQKETNKIVELKK